MIINSLKSKYFQYKKLAEDAVDQVPDNKLNSVFGEDDNSIAIIMNHIAGNLKSRFTDFLTSDGEKSWRNRDSEFETHHLDRTALLNHWEKGWQILFDALQHLSDDDLNQSVKIRGKELSVFEALLRSLIHITYHVGQIVYIAKTSAGNQWKSLSIPKGESEAYNKNPNREK
jgi:hypothetical protein